MIQVLDTIKIIDIDHNELPQHLVELCMENAAYIANDTSFHEYIVSPTEVLDEAGDELSTVEQYILIEILNLLEDKEASYFRIVIKQKQ